MTYNPYFSRMSKSKGEPQNWLFCDFSLKIFIYVVSATTWEWDILQDHGRRNRCDLRKHIPLPTEDPVTEEPLNLLGFRTLVTSCWQGSTKYTRSPKLREHLGGGQSILTEGVPFTGPGFGGHKGTVLLSKLSSKRKSSGLPLYPSYLSRNDEEDPSPGHRRSLRWGETCTDTLSLLRPERLV